MTKKSTKTTKSPTPAKPTAGPFTIRHNLGCGYAVENANGTTVGWFSQVSSSTKGESICEDEARANAQSFIDGMAAIETLGKIRDVWNDECMKWDETHRLVAILLGVGK